MTPRPACGSSRCRAPGEVGTSYIARGARILALGAAFGALGGGAGACNGEQLRPDPGLTGAGAGYVLRSAGDALVPAVWISNESVTVTVVADTIRLREGGRGDRVLVEKYQEETPMAPRTRREAGGFDYVRRGDRIEITLPCADMASCVAPPHFVGRITPDGLVFERALNYRTPLRYERVGR
ncbi:MAG: hypothetical protein ACREOF_21570 [Gemmatimonadales bacterium]